MRPLVCLLRRRFVFVFVGRIVIRRIGFEFGGAGVHGFEGGDDAAQFPQLADFQFARREQLCQLTVGEAEPLGLAKGCVVQVGQFSDRAQSLFHFHDLGQADPETRDRYASARRSPPCVMPAFRA